MLGAIIGDIAGSAFEHDPIKTIDFRIFDPSSTFTDDTVLTVAVAKAILDNVPYEDTIGDFALRYPKRGYGGTFQQWVNAWERVPYNSYGNGSAMRVSPVALAYESADEVLREAKCSAEITHNHPEGIKGAEATALMVFMARKGKSKDRMREVVSERFGYDLNRTCDQIRETYEFNLTCQGSVPESIIAFLDSTSYEECIRLAISLGGDTDTMACIAGGIAQAYYKDVPGQMVDEAMGMLPDEFAEIVIRFNERYL